MSHFSCFLDPYNGALKRLPVDLFRIKPRAKKSIGYRCKDFSISLVTVGGIDPCNTTENHRIARRVCMYDIKTKTWRDLPDLPEPRFHHVLVSVKNDFYVIGGFVIHKCGRILATKSTFCFNHFTQTWSQKADMINARAFHGGVALNEQILIVGGRNDAVVFSSLELYCVESNEWNFYHSMPFPKMAMGATLYKGDLWIFGGVSRFGNCTVNRDKESLLSEVYSLDLANRSWVRKPDLCTPRAYCSAVTFQGMMYVWGGLITDDYCGLASCDIVEVYNPMTMSCRIAFLMTTPRHCLALTTCDKYIFCLGGMSSYAGTALASADIYDRENGINEEDPFISTPLSGMAALGLWNRILTPLFDQKIDCKEPC